MQWIHKFQLFLFDFDGLLVNTERLHYQAYVKMLAGRGISLRWDFERFCSLAHRNATALREALYAEYPTLDPDWSALYAEKKRAYGELIANGKIELMPGVAPLLAALEKANIERCVVTNSFHEQIATIRFFSKPLQSIAHWITREQYNQPKPSPECYQLAIERYAKPGDRVIGFEDSLRGLQALQGSSALAVLVCAANHPLLAEVAPGTLHTSSLENISHCLE